MTVYFLDASALVKRYHGERGSEVIDALFAEQGRRIIISDLSIIEFGSALSRKVREGEITPEKDHRALGFFCQDILTETIHVEILGDVHKALAATLIEKYGFRANLRTLDSLQLARMKRAVQSELDQVLCADRTFCSIIQRKALRFGIRKTSLLHSFYTSNWGPTAHLGTGPTRTHPTALPHRGGGQCPRSPAPQWSGRGCGSVRRRPQSTRRR
jgi:predicted nucleic acid-binding protein